jgi:hypothetical protein
MKNFFAGFIIATLLFMTVILIQKVTYEKEKYELIENMSHENYKDKMEIAKLSRISKGKAQVIVTQYK